MHQWCFQHCHNCNLIPANVVPANVWKNAVPVMMLPEKNMCVHWDQMSTSVWLCALPLASLPRLLFHTLYYHTESDWRARLQQRPYFSLNPTSSSVHLCTGYCAFLLCGEQNSIQWREITKHSRHTCFHFRRALMFPGSLVSTTVSIVQCTTVRQM